MSLVVPFDRASVIRRPEPRPSLAVLSPMAEPRTPETSIVAQARKERARLQEAEAWANEVLARVAGKTPTTGTTHPPQVPVVGSYPTLPARVGAGASERS